MDNKGYLTTEFWGNMAAVMVAYLMSTGISGDPDTIWSKSLIAFGAMLTSLGYTVMRGGVKKAYFAAAAITSELEKE